MTLIRPKPFLGVLLHGSVHDIHEVFQYQIPQKHKHKYRQYLLQKHNGLPLIHIAILRRQLSLQFFQTGLWTLLPELLHEVDDQGDSALHLCLYLGRWELFEWLLWQRMNPHGMNHKGLSIQTLVQLKPQELQIILQAAQARYDQAQALKELWGKQPQLLAPLPTILWYHLILNYIF